MGKPFVSLQTQIPFSQALQRVLEFHLLKGASIIDPTPGEKHSWRYYLSEVKNPSFFPVKKFNITFIDDDISNFNKTKLHVDNQGVVDAMFFDPPYIFGYEENKGSRQGDYGGYHHGFEDVKSLIQTANEEIPKFLKAGGLLFLKYTDVFSLSERKFYFCAPLWANEFTNFRAKDHYIIQHHHVSPTAWQVKDRPCGIVNYTYLTVFRQVKHKHLGVSK